MQLPRKGANIEAPQCQQRDWTCNYGGLLVWCLPAVALIAGLDSPLVRTWLWIPAFLIMGFGCVANAARCGRLHCYFSAPIFLLAAVYVAAALLHLLPFAPAALINAVFALVILAFLIEIPLGRYRTRASR